MSYEQVDCNGAVLQCVLLYYLEHYYEMIHLTVKSPVFFFFFLIVNHIIINV